MALAVQNLSSEALNSQLLAGGLSGSSRGMPNFVRSILKSRVLKLVYFNQLMGQEYRQSSSIISQSLRRLIYIIPVQIGINVINVYACDTN